MPTPRSPESDDLPPKESARYKAKRSHQRFYVVSKGAQPKGVIAAADFGIWRQYGYRIDFMAFPRRRR